MNHKLITLENLKKFKEELNTADLKTFVKFGNDRLYIALAEQAPSSEWENGETGILLSYYDLPDGWSVYNGIIVKDTRSDTTYSSSTGEDAQIKYKIISSLSGVSTEKEIVARSLSKAEFDLLPDEQKKTGYPYWLSDGYYVNSNGTAIRATSGNYYIRLGFPVSKGGIVGYEAPEGWHIYNNILLKDDLSINPIDQGNYNYEFEDQFKFGRPFDYTTSVTYTIKYESGANEERTVESFPATYDMIKKAGEYNIINYYVKGKENDNVNPYYYVDGINDIIAQDTIFREMISTYTPYGVSKRLSTDSQYYIQQWQNGINFRFGFDLEKGKIKKISIITPGYKLVKDRIIGVIEDAELNTAKKVCEYRAYYEQYECNYIARLFYLTTRLAESGIDKNYMSIEGCNTIFPHVDYDDTNDSNTYSIKYYTTDSIGNLTSNGDQYTGSAPDVPTPYLGISDRLL